MKKKIFLIILILIILTIASFFIWRFWPKEKTKTFDWQTYTNNERRFEFKYPEDWEIKIDPAFDKVIALEKIDLTQEKVSFPFGVEDEYIYPIYTIHFQAETEEYFKSLMADNNYNIQKIELGNFNVYQFKDATAPSSGSAIVTLLEKDGRYISVTYIAYAHSETHFKFEHIYDQIISTFKFID